jgi:protein CLEC16A
MCQGGRSACVLVVVWCAVHDLVSHTRRIIRSRERGRMSFFSLFRKQTTPERFSLDNLKKLYANLARNPVINEANQSVIVETLRNIAEHIVWGDQNDPTIFEFFMEKNILSFMLGIVSPRTVGLDVKIQLIQTISMMVENIRTPGSLCK